MGNESEDDGTHHNKNNNDGRTKGITAPITMAGIVVTAALLSGLFSINSYYQPAIAQQQNMTGGVDGGNATTGAARVNMSEVRHSHRRRRAHRIRRRTRPRGK